MVPTIIIISFITLWVIHLGFANADMRNHCDKTWKRYPDARRAKEREEAFWFAFGWSFGITLMPIIGTVVLMTCTNGFKHGWTLSRK